MCELMSDAPLALSVLDLVPVRTGQTSAQAITASLTTADASFSRYPSRSSSVAVSLMIRL